MRLFLIDPHRKDFYNNGLFDDHRNPELIIFKQIRIYLKTKNILLDTIDRHHVTQADQIFFFDHEEQTLLKTKHRYLDECIRSKISKSRLNLIIWECPIIKPSNWKKINHRYYRKVFTWNDRLTNNYNYLHYYWPQNLLGYSIKTIPYTQKKLLTLINAHKTNYQPNELYSLRIKAIRYFEKHHKNDFDLYGIGWEKPLDIKYAYSALPNLTKSLIFIYDYIKSHRPFTSYRGPIKNKYDILKNYRFALCFENMANINGYITEKIFDCFKAKTVPIYFGAQNISKYIPKNLFIDWRQFNDFSNLFTYLKSYSEKQYTNQINQIIKFNKTIESNWGYRRFALDIFLKT